MQRIVDITGDHRHLSKDRGHLVVSSKAEEIGRVPLDDIAAVIVHAAGATYSNTLICALAARGALMVLCGRNHAPVAVLSPLIGHHAQTERMVAQASAALPLKKRLWQAVVRSKIRMQAATLAAAGVEASGFYLLERKVKSGDSENVEAQAARRYWPLLLGSEFRRDVGASGVNGLLNYGYAVMRATVARGVVAAGLNLSLGIHHHNRQNAFALADDLIEPFRPIVDIAVLGLMDEGIEEVGPEAKARLATLPIFDLPSARGQSPVHVCANRLAASLAKSFCEKNASLELPEPADPLALRGAGKAA